MILSWLIRYLPLLIVWLIGVCLAFGRWPRHPRVSALLLAAIGLVLVSTLGMQIATQFLVRQVIPSGGPASSRMLFFSLLAFIASPVRAAGWIALLAATFTGRVSAATAGGLPKLQFSIRGLLLLTAIVAVLCGAVRIAIGWLGESSVILLNLLDDIPIAICWLGGAWIATVRWRAHPQVSACTLAGIALSAFTTLILQAVWIVMVVNQTGYWALSLLNWVYFVIGPLVWSLHLTAAFGWRAGVNPFAFGPPADPPVLLEPRV